jgi:hypothetical protein
MRRPGRRSDQLAARMRLIHGNVDVGAGRHRDVGRYGRVATARPVLNHARRGQYLGAVADRRNRLIRAREMPNDLQHPRIQPDVLRRAAAGDHQRIIGFRTHLVEGGIEGELCPRFSL